MADLLPVRSMTRCASSSIVISRWLPDVVDLPAGLGAADQQLQRPHHIRHMAEAAGLRPVAVDLKRLPAQRPPDKARDDHAVHAGLARPTVLKKRTTVPGMPVDRWNAMT